MNAVPVVLASSGAPRYYIKQAGTDAAVIMCERAAAARTMYSHLVSLLTLEGYWVWACSSSAGEN